GVALVEFENFAAQLPIQPIEVPSSIRVMIPHRGAQFNLRADQAPEQFQAATVLLRNSNEVESLDIPWRKPSEVNIAGKIQSRKLFQSHLLHNDLLPSRVSAKIHPLPIEVMRRNPFNRVPQPGYVDSIWKSVAVLFRRK